MMNTDTGYVIQAKNLSKHFGHFKAVDRISFEVNRGEIFGFLGANGAGKTTVMRMLTGLSTPGSGEAFVNGFNVYTRAEAIKKTIGYMSQKFSLYEDLTVRQNIGFYGGIYGLSTVDLHQKTQTISDELQLGAVVTR